MTFEPNFKIQTCLESLKNVLIIVVYSNFNLFISFTYLYPFEKNEHKEK